MKPVYVGVMLDDPKELLRWWESSVGGLLPKRIAHHMTIQFVPAVDEVAALPVGEPVTLDVVGYANSGEVQAVVVRPRGVASANRIPHVTVATDGVTSSAKSNDLLAEGWIHANGPTLTGRVGFFAGGREWFDLGVLGRTASRVRAAHKDPCNPSGQGVAWISPEGRWYAVPDGVGHGTWALHQVVYRNGLFAITGEWRKFVRDPKVVTAVDLFHRGEPFQVTRTRFLSVPTALRRDGRLVEVLNRYGVEPGTLHQGFDEFGMMADVRDLGKTFDKVVVIDKERPNPDWTRWDAARRDLEPGGRTGGVVSEAIYDWMSDVGWVRVANVWNLSFRRVGAPVAAMGAWCERAMKCIRPGFDVEGMSVYLDGEGRVPLVDFVERSCSPATVSRFWDHLGVLGRTASVRVALRNADPVPSTPAYYAGVLGPTVTYTGGNPTELTRGKGWGTQVVRVDTNRGTVDFDMSWNQVMSRRQGLPNKNTQQTYVIPSGDVAFRGMSNTQTVKLLRHLMSADPRITTDFRILNSERYHGRTVGDVAGDPRDVDVAVTGRGRGGMPTPLVAYHGTSMMRAKTILKEGFVPGRQRFTYVDQVPGYTDRNVYLTVNPEDAENYATRQAVFDKSNAAVLKVTIPPDELENIVFDEDMATGWVPLTRPYTLTVVDESQFNGARAGEQAVYRDEFHVGRLFRWMQNGTVADDDEFRSLVSAVFDPRKYLKASLQRGLITYAGTIPASWVELYRTYPRVKYPPEDELRFDEYQRIRHETQERMVRHVAARSMR